METEINVDLIPEGFDSIVEGLLEKMKNHSPETYYHLIDVADLSRILGDDPSFGLSQEQKEQLYTAALLHDIGKLTIKPEILHDKNCSDSERLFIQYEHIESTKDMLQGVFPDSIVDMAYKHHERIDGSGYPRNLSGDELNIEDRIIAVADVASALLLSRSYKNAFSIEHTMAILYGCVSRGELDPIVVDKLGKYLSNHPHEDIAETHQADDEMENL